MRILHKVHPTEVKRAFVISQKMRFSRKKGKKYLPKLAKTEFLKKLKQAKTTAKKLNEKQLDKIITDEYPKRADAYNNTNWHRAVVSTSEVGVWRRAGGLPAQWTCCSLSQTSRKVKNGSRQQSKLIRARAKRIIPRIMEFIDIIRREKYLSPVVFVSGTGTRGRRWCKTRVKGDIDDGCMRAIALAVSGHTTLSVYFGKPKSL